MSFLMGFSSCKDESHEEITHRNTYIFQTFTSKQKFYYETEFISHVTHNVCEICQQVKVQKLCGPD